MENKNKDLKVNIRREINKHCFPEKFIYILTISTLRVVLKLNVKES